MAAVKAGVVAPDFELSSHQGGTVRLSNYRGKSDVVLYFYPRDNTSVCTAEACSFRDHLGDFSSKGAQVLGVSVDSVDSHKAFAQGNRLNFPLLADPDGKVAALYGILGTFPDGKPAAQRVTFLIDKKGVVREVQQLWDLKTPIKDVLESHTQTVRDHVPDLAGRV